MMLHWHTYNLMSLSRDVFIRPSPHDLEIPELRHFLKEGDGDVLKLDKPLYGLADAGDLWHHTIDLHLRNDLNMDKCKLDKSLYFKNANDDDDCTPCIIGQYVDDSIICGNLSFEKATEATLSKFECRKRSYLLIRFAGVYISRIESTIALDQAEYVSKLKLLPERCSFVEFRKLRAQLAWVMHTRPDICFNVSTSAQITEASFRPDHIDRMNKTVRHLRRYHLKLKFQHLDTGSMHIRAYSDSSFANNEDLLSQLGFIILLCDKSLRCNVLHYASYKARRVTRSVLGAETYAFADALDFAYTLANDLRSMTSLPLPLKMCTDSRSLFDLITKDSTSTERRLMIDISAVRSAYENAEINSIELVASCDNPADAFTKQGKCPSLEIIITTDVDRCQPVQWVHL